VVVDGTVYWGNGYTAWAHPIPTRVYVFYTFWLEHR